MTCSRSDGSVAGGNWPLWVYQAPGSVPKGLVGSDGVNNHNVKPPGVFDRYTGSISEGTSILSINNMKADDEGVYFCALWNGNAHTDTNSGTARH